MGRFSREKGKRGEREARDKLLELFDCEAHRGRQFQGSPDSPDVVSSLPGVHFEVKRTEKLSVYAAVQQAVVDSGIDDVPVVLHKSNGNPWLAIIPLDLLPQLCVSLASYARGLHDATLRQAPDQTLP